jgi:hypothetical protein
VVWEGLYYTDDMLHRIPDAERIMDRKGLFPPELVSEAEGWSTTCIPNPVMRIVGKVLTERNDHNNGSDKNSHKTTNARRRELLSLQQLQNSG